MRAADDEVRSINDWEIWSRSDPRIDLSWLLFCTDEARHPVVPADLDSGMPSDAELLAAYEPARRGPRRVAAPAATVPLNGKAKAAPNGKQVAVAAAGRHGRKASR